LQSIAYQKSARFGSGFTRSQTKRRGKTILRSLARFVSTPARYLFTLRRQVKDSSAATLTVAATQATPVTAEDP